MHTKGLKETLDDELILEKVHKVVEFIQEAWLEPYIDKKMELRTKTKNDFGKDFIKLMSNSVFGKTMENVRKRRDIKLCVINEIFCDKPYCILQNAT